MPADDQRGNSLINSGLQSSPAAQTRTIEALLKARTSDGIG
jgi:hypothetical protein